MVCGSSARHVKNAASEQFWYRYAQQLDIAAERGSRTGAAAKELNLGTTVHTEAEGTAEVGALVLYDPEAGACSRGHGCDSHRG